MSDEKTIHEYPLILDKDLLDPLEGKEGSVNDINFEVIIDKYKHLFEEKDKILIVAGDSFSHGDELGDTDRPDFPGFNKFHNFTPEEDALRKKRKEWHDYIRRKELTFTLDELKVIWTKERNRSYPMLIQRERPDILVINLAKGGTSTTRNARLIINLTILLKELYPNKSIEVILGVSGHQRTEERIKHGYLSFIPSNFPDKTTPYYNFFELYIELYLNYFDDDTLIEKWLFTLIHFVNIMNSLKVKHHLLVTEVVLYYLNQNPYYKKLCEKYKLIIGNRLDFVLFLSVEEGLRYFYDAPIYLPGGHYNSEIHEFFKNKIITQLFNNG